MQTTSAPPSRADATFAVAEDGRIVHVSDVARGRACNCRCVACNGPVVARQGSRNAWCFAHDTLGSCATAAETALHRALKQVIADGSVIGVADLKVEAVATYEGHTKSASRVVERQRLEYGNSRLEVRLGDIVADAVVAIAGGDMIVEVAVTHLVDEQKAQKIVELGLSAIELQAWQLSRNADWDELRAFVQDSYANRIWIHHARKQFMTELAHRDALRQARDAARRVAPLRPSESGNVTQVSIVSTARLDDSDAVAKFRNLWSRYHRGTLRRVRLDVKASQFVGRWFESDAKGDPYVYFNELIDWIRTRTDSVIEAD